jgi:hypothetical protein
VLEDHGAVAVKVLIEGNAVMREPQKPGKPPYTVLGRLRSDVLAVHFWQIKGAQDSALVL